MAVGVDQARHHHQPRALDHRGGGAGIAAADLQQLSPGKGDVAVGQVDVPPGAGVPGDDPAPGGSA